ncbi:MAG: hypothetical protein H7210_00365 [Pyrinomonadaceae bacterium]|nr:hypothetical protein [Phycisphaerales bacterium]
MTADIVPQCNLSANNSTAGPDRVTAQCTYDAYRAPLTALFFFQYYAIGLLLLFALSSHVSAQPSITRECTIPPESVIWWRFDPTPLTGQAPGKQLAPPDLAANLNARLSSAILRAAVASRVVPSDAVASVLEVTLAASEAGAAPHTLAVLALTETAFTTRPSPARAGPKSTLAETPIQLKAVLDLQTSVNHQALVRTIEAILVDPSLPQDKRGVQRIFTIPAGNDDNAQVTPQRTVAAFRRAEWPESLEVSWCSTPGHFTVAIGVGVMERWFAVQDAAQPPPAPASTNLGRSPFEEAQAHRRFINILRRPSTPPGRPDAAPPADQHAPRVFEFFMDCNHLRAGLEKSFTSALKPESQGRGARMLQSWNLSSARSFMVHARLIPPQNVLIASRADDLPALLDPALKSPAYEGPPLLVIDATWSSRSNALGDISHRSISQPFWPQQDLGKPPPGSFAMVFPADLSSLLDVSTDFYAGLVAPGGARRHDRSVNAWHRKMSGVIQRQQRRLGRWIVLIGPESSAGGVLADLAILCPLDREADPRQFGADLLTMLSPFKDALQAPDEGGIHTLSADSLGALNLAAWITLPRDAHTPGTLIAAFGFGLTQDVAKARVTRLSDWVKRQPQTP